MIGLHTFLSYTKTIYYFCIHTLQACVLSRFSRVKSTLCDPMDFSPPGSPVHGIFQARILEWVAMPSSRGPSQAKNRTCVSYVSGIGRRVLYHWCHLGSPVYMPYFCIINSPWINLTSLLLNCSVYLGLKVTRQ